MQTSLSFLIWLGALVVITATALPLTRSVRWWVRAWEFPRVQIAVFALICLIGAVAVPVPFQATLVVLLAVCLFYQLVLIFPYTRFARREVEYLIDYEEKDTVTFLAANVLMENTRTKDLLKIIEREDPDVVLLMETDETWLSALKGCLDSYPTVLTYPLDNYYGMIFATRLSAPRAEFVFLSDDNTPALVSELIAPSGGGFNFIGLHPTPPVPGQTTKERDEQIKKAAVLTSKAEWPSICMGDFNDVAWSWTTKRLKHLGGYKEPRIGRGMFPTFHAQYPLLRVPIDQLFVTEGVGLVSFDRLEEFGSDHFPIRAVVTVPKHD